MPPQPAAGLPPAGGLKELHLSSISHPLRRDTSHHSIPDAQDPTCAVSPRRRSSQLAQMEHQLDTEMEAQEAQIANTYLVKRRSVLLALEQQRSWLKQLLQQALATPEVDLELVGAGERAAILVYEQHLELLGEKETAELRRCRDQFRERREALWQSPPAKAAAEPEGAATPVVATTSEDAQLNRRKLETLLSRSQGPVPDVQRPPVLVRRSGSPKPFQETRLARERLLQASASLPQNLHHNLKPALSIQTRSRHVQGKESVDDIALLNRFQAPSAASAYDPAQERQPGRAINLHAPTPISTLELHSCAPDPLPRPSFVQSPLVLEIFGLLQPEGFSMPRAISKSVPLITTAQLEQICLVEQRKKRRTGVMLEIDPERRVLRFDVQKKKQSKHWEVAFSDVECVFPTTPAVEPREVSGAAVKPEHGINLVFRAKRSMFSRSPGCRLLVFRCSVDAANEFGPDSLELFRLIRGLTMQDLPAAGAFGWPSQLTVMESEVIWRLDLESGKKGKKKKTKIWRRYLVLAASRLLVYEIKSGKELIPAAYPTEIIYLAGASLRMEDAEYLTVQPAQSDPRHLSVEGRDFKRWKRALQQEISAATGRSLPELPAHVLPEPEPSAAAAKSEELLEEL